MLLYASRMSFLKCLIYINSVCVDAAALGVHSRKLCGINGVGAWMYDGDRVGVERLDPW
jgi:hypothetical protein